MLDVFCYSVVGTPTVVTAQGEWEAHLRCLIGGGLCP